VVRPSDSAGFAKQLISQRKGNQMAIFEINAVEMAANAATAAERAVATGQTFTLTAETDSALHQSVSGLLSAAPVFA